MDELEEVKADLVEIKGIAGKVKVDVEGLHAKIDSFPAPGMTPEQIAALAEIKAMSKDIKDSLAGVDAMTDDPVVEPPVVEPPQQEPPVT